MANLTTSIQFTHNQRTFKLTVEETSYSIADNTSDVKWTVQISGSSATGANYHDSYVKAWVNDQVVVNLTKTWDAKVFPAADGTKTGTITGILHDSITGQKTINLKIEGYSYTYSTQSKTGTFTLTELPRKSNVSISNNGEVTAGGNAVTIYTNRVSGSGFTHDISLYDGGTWVQDIATGVTESTTFSPTLSTYANKIRSGSYKNYTVQCVTKNNGSSIGTSTATLKIIIPNNATTKPTASISLSEGGSVPSGWNVFVKGKSQLSITVNGSTYQNSTITSVSCSALGSTRTGTSVPLSYNAGAISSSGSVSATVTDSRGFTSNSVTQSYTVYDYGAPSILSNTSVRRCDTSGNITDNGTNVKIAFYAKVYKVNGNNAKNFRVGFRTLGSTGSFTYKTYSSTSNDSNYWYLDVAETRITDSGWTNFSASTSYEFRFEVWDSFTSSSPITMTKVLSTQFDLINFNKNGQAIAFGKISEATGTNKLFEVGMPSTFRDNVTVSSGKTISGALSGNATTATTATKLGSSTVGSATKPIYLNAGAPTAGTQLADAAYKGVVNQTTKTYIATGTNVPTVNSIAYWNGAYNSSNSSNLTYCSGGTIANTGQLPTGSFNGNKGYVRFPNIKLQICWEQTGYSGDGITVTANAVTTKDFTFPATFSAVPTVITLMNSGSSAQTVGYISHSAWSQTTSGFQYRAFSKDSSNRKPHVGYIAIGPYT